MKSDNYRPNLSSLREVLADNRRYEIPDYQRRYRWDVQKIDELWEDLIDMYKDHDHRKNEYLLGSIVTVRGSNRRTEMVVDGQQRLVSLTLMFCSIRNVLSRHMLSADYNLKNRISNLINTIDERIHEKEEVFIKLNHTADNALLKHICLFGKHDKQDEHYRKLSGRAGKAIYKNYKALSVNAAALCKNLDILNSNLKGIGELEEIIKAVIDRVCVIDITVEDENDAQQIFEALNSKGQQLTQSDLIKSYLIQKSPAAKKDWDDALLPFEAEIKRNPRKSDEYIYYSILSREATGKDVGKRELYRWVKSMAGKKTPDEFIAELKEDVAITQGLEKPRSNPPLDHLLHGLKQVNAIYFRRPIIAAVRTWGWEDRRTGELIEFLLKFFFMYRSVCKMDVDKIRGIAKDLTNDIITNGKNAQSVDLYKKPLGVVGKIVKDGTSTKIDLDEFHDRFLEDFINMEYDRKGVTLYIFISIERLLQNGQFVIPAKGFDVEHVFPQKAKMDAWPNKAELKRYKNNIGNLTLLPHRWNKTLQNYSFEVKKTGIKNHNEKTILTGKDSKDKHGEPIVCSYQNSNFEINVDIKKCTKWDTSEVMKRQELLKKHAEKIWDLREYL